MSLNPPESARACGILECAIEKLSFLGGLTPAAKLEGGAAAASALAGDEIRRTIADQAVREVQYTEALEALTVSAGAHSPLASQARERLEAARAALARLTEAP